MALAIATGFAFDQAPRPDPFLPLRAPSLDWFLHPVERNAFKRLPVLNADLRGLAVLPDGRNLWVVGSEGMIAHSADGGKTWQQQASPEAPVTMTPAATTIDSTASSAPGADTSATPARPPRAPSGLKSSGNLMSFVGEAQAAAALPTVDSTARQQNAPMRVLTVQQSPAARPNPIGEQNAGQRSLRASPPGKSGARTTGTISTRTPPNGKTARARDGSAAPEPGATETASVDLHAVCFVDAGRGWAVGDGGVILATRDGGNLWSRQASGTRAGLNSVQFLKDGLHGWAVGGDVILSTTDGGADWSLQELPLPLLGLHAVFFLEDGLRGWAVGGFGREAFLTHDGGRHWTMSRPSPPGLNSLTMSSDGETGWAVGDGGVLTVTRDGGESWSAPDPTAVTTIRGFRADLRSIQLAAGGRRGWAVGDSGTVLTMTEPGARWTRTTIPGRPALTAVRFVDRGRRGWAIGDRGTILQSDDGGAHWKPQSLGRRGILMSVALADSRRGWAVGLGGTILATLDGGNHWEAESSGVDAELYAVSAPARSHQVWSCGAAGTLLSWSRDGGRWTIRPFPGGPEDDLISLFFLPDGRAGWVCGLDRLYSTVDAGAHWQPRATTAIYSVFPGRVLRVAADGRRGWMMTDDGIVHPTRDGFASLEYPVAQMSQTSTGGTALSAIGGDLADDGRHGIVIATDEAGTSGWVMTTADGGLNWSAPDSVAPPGLLSVRLLGSGRSGWAVGTGGLVLATSDSAAHWRPLRSGTESTLKSVDFSRDGGTGVAVGLNGAIIRTTDAGLTWTAPRYARLPAPWFWLFAFLVIVALILPAFDRSAAPAAERASVADMLASDRPIRRGDPDPLGSLALAAGVARFLGNEHTEPPLTIAVTGEWGTGKSSVMNLIRSEVGDYGFRSVWFNAWHHQTEEHMLAALMESIRRQAVPPWWLVSEAALFRVRLLLIRGARRLLAAALLIVVCSALFVYGYTRHALEALQSLLEFKAPEAFAGGSSLLALALSVLLPLRAVLRTMTAFNLGPNRLAAFFSAGTRSTDFRSQIGFRQQFAEAFEEVLWALRPNRLVIFIDDLDRCQPENAVRVLEMVNFLVSSGDCHIVMGMALKWVERSVGLGFERVASEMIDDGDEDRSGAAAPAEGVVPAPGTPTPAQSAVLVPGTGAKSAAEDQDRRAREKRHEFARSYLEKLVNIEVPLPRASDQQARKLLLPDPPRRPWWAPILRRYEMWLEFVLALAVAGTLIWMGARFGPPQLDALVRLFPPRPTPGETKLAPADRIVAPPDTVTIAITPPPTSAHPNPKRTGNLAGPPVVLSGQRNGWPAWPAYVLLAMMLVGGALRLSVRRKGPERDSLPFREALDLWHPLVYASNPTPRSVKRFLNRVRYYAMAQRGTGVQEPSQPLLERLGIRPRRPVTRDGAAPAEAASIEIPSHILVALGAIQHAHPKWLDDDALWASLAGFLATQKLPESISKRLPEIDSYGPILAYRERFTEISEGIDVRG